MPASRCRSRPRAFYRCSRRHPWPSACTASYPVHFGTTAHPPTRTRNTSVTEFLPIHDFAGGRKGAAYKCKEMGENGEGSLEAGATSGEDFVIRYASTIEIDDFVDKDGIINEFALLYRLRTSFVLHYLQAGLVAPLPRDQHRADLLPCGRPVRRQRQDGPVYRLGVWVLIAANGKVFKPTTKANPSLSGTWPSSARAAALTSTMTMRGSTWRWRWARRARRRSRRPHSLALVHS